MLKNKQKQIPDKLERAWKYTENNDDPETISEKEPLKDMEKIMTHKSCQNTFEKQLWEKH